MKPVMGFIALGFFMMVAIPQSNSQQCNTPCNRDNQVDVCGKSGSTCRHFPSPCNQILFNCARNTTYATVPLARCRGIRIGSGGPCQLAGANGVSLPTVSVIRIPGSTIIPIIIRRRPRRLRS